MAKIWIRARYPGRVELAFTIGYIVANPVRAGLVAHPAQYPYLGSLRYTVPELLEICEYERISSA